MNNSEARQTICDAIQEALENKLFFKVTEKGKYIVNKHIADTLYAIRHYAATGNAQRVRAVKATGRYAQLIRHVKKVVSGSSVYHYNAMVKAAGSRPAGEEYQDAVLNFAMTDETAPEPITLKQMLVENERDFEQASDESVMTEDDQAAFDAFVANEVLDDAEADQQPDQPQAPVAEVVESKPPVRKGIRAWLKNWAAPFFGKTPNDATT